jgi:predicted dehydrogenase/sugar phosphate isomerase/epimerase
MQLSIFTDELGMDVTKALPIIKGWGLDVVDFRGRMFGKPIERLTDEELTELRKQLDDLGMRTGCIESSLAKVHLPDAERMAAEAEKLEGIIRAADALDCRLVRSFFYWQPTADSGLQGALAIRPDEQQKVMDAFAPLAKRAKEANLVLAFENCGVCHDEVIAMLSMFDVPEWGMAWDVANTWNCPEREQGVEAYCKRLIPYARQLHVKARGAVPGIVDFSIPWDTVLDIAANAGLQGPVSVETHNPDKTKSNEDVSKQLVNIIQAAWPSAAPGSNVAKGKSAADVTRPWQDNPVRYAVIGLGMGHNRAKMISQTPGCELVGVCDLDESRAKRTGEAFNVPYCTDMQRWLDDDSVEAVFVMTETGRHGEVTLAALEAGKHVVSTKPMEASLAACDAMVKKAEEKGLLLAVDFGRRFNTDLVTLRHTVGSGAFGKLLSGSFELKILRTMDYFNSNGGWRGTRRWDGGGVLSNQSIHHIDELAYAVGLPEKVRCVLWTQNHEIEAEDLGMASWLYADGSVLTFTGTTNYPHSTWFDRVELVGTEGAYFRAENGPFDKPMERFFLNGAWRDEAPETVEPEWLNSADNFAAAIRTGAPLVCTGRDGRRTQSILDAMYRSAYEADGQWVELAPDLA